MDESLRRAAGRLEKSETRDWEVYLERVRVLSIDAREDAVDAFTRAETAGLAVRVLDEGRPGFAYTTDLSEAAIGLTVDSAREASRLSTPEPKRLFPAPGEESGGPAPELDLVDPALASAPEKDKAELALTLEARILMGDSRMRKVRKASYEERDYALSIVNSAGLSRSGRGATASLSASAMGEEQGDAQIGWFVGQGRRLADLDPDAVARGVVRRTVELLGAKPVASRSGPAVLDPYVVLDLLDILAPSFSADAVQMGRSLLAGRLEEKIFSKNLTVVDDGVLPDGFGSFPFDGEGTARRRSVLVEQGVLKGYLYDALTASREGRFSTGNAVRAGYAAPPGVGTTNLFLEPGRGGLDDLLAEMGRGILVTDVIGAHTANPVTGDFSVGCSGFVVEGGKRSAPFKGMGLSGNLLDLLGRVGAVGGDLTFVGRTGAPSLLLEKVDLSGV